MKKFQIISLTAFSLLGAVLLSEASAVTCQEFNQSCNAKGCDSLTDSNDKSYCNQMKTNYENAGDPNPLSRACADVEVYARNNNRCN